MTPSGAAQVALFLCLPAMAGWAAKKNRVAGAIGPVVLCYAAGILMANAPGAFVEPQVSLGVSEVAVPLAIPLLLFSTDARSWLGLARGFLVAFGLACLAAVVAAAGVGLAFRGQVDEWWKVAGMLVAVYIGGTANMSAVGLAVGTRSETFVVLNAADVVCGGAYLLFLLSLAPKLLGRFLRPFPTPDADALADDDALKAQPPRLASVLAALGLATLVVGASAALSLLALGRLEPGLTLLLITTGGIAASTQRRVRGLAGAYEAGEYVLLVFCVAVGSLADLRQLGGASLLLLGFVALVLVAAAALHFGLCRLFHVDRDTALISSTAAIFGPPFIGPVAAALKNRTIVGPGLSLGLAGIALGTYFGLGVAWGLRALFGG